MVSSSGDGVRPWTETDQSRTNGLAGQCDKNETLAAAPSTYYQLTMANDLRIDLTPLAHGIRQATLHGHVDSTSASSLVGLLRPERRRSVVVDLVHVGAMSSAGAVALLTIAADFRDAGGELVLARPTRAVRNVLVTLGVPAEVPLTETIEAAVVRLTPKRPRRSGQSSDRLQRVLV